MAVELTQSGGYTFGGENGGAYKLNEAVSLTTKNAEVKPSSLTMRISVGLDQITRAMDSETAFMNGTKIYVQSLIKSTANIIENICFYGQTGLGKTASFTDAGTNLVEVAIKDGTYAAGIWVGAENSPFDLHAADGTKVNDDRMVVDKISVTDKTVTLKTSAGDKAKLEALASDARELDFHYLGARGREMAGLDKIITNRGNLFGIDSSQYALWRGNVYDAGGKRLSLSITNKALAPAVNKGLDEDVTQWVNPDTFYDLVEEQAASRRYDVSYKGKAETGFKAIEFYTLNGMSKVVSHLSVKDGECFILPMKKVLRGGSSDVTFNPVDGRRIFFDLPEHSGIEMRLFSDQFIFCEAPAQCVKIENIVNGAEA